MSNLMQQPIRNRWSGEIQFTAEIAADEATPLGVRIGLAVRWAPRTGADLRGADLGGAYLRDADLRGAYLGGAYLGDADLRGAYLRDADLGGAYLRDADLRGAYLGGAYLGDADLGDADLRGAYLRDADLRGAYLGGAYLRGAYLRGAYLRDADLRDADLRGAYLGGADLRGADLRGADLRGADLGGDKIKRLVARLDRSDGYQFTALELEGGGVKIQAGCRWLTLAEYRSHVLAEYPDTDKAAETTAILDFIAVRCAQIGVSPEPAAAAERRVA